MSIINDALKKAQLTRKLEKEKQAKLHTSAKTEGKLHKATKIEKPDEPKVIRKSDVSYMIKIASFLTITAMLAVLLFTNQAKIFSLGNNALQIAMNNKTAPKAKSNVTFEGVFLSNNTKIALINNRSMHVGDMVNGMRIVAINQDTIDLQNANGVIELKAGAVYRL